MFLYIVKWSIIYIVIIYLLHSLYIFFEENITCTQYKDHIVTNNTEMKNINSILSNKNNDININKNNDNMECELNEFLNTLNKI